MAPVEDQFLQGLQDFGYIDGNTIHIELRTAEGNIDLLKPLAQELVGLGVSTIVALFTPAVVAAKQATQQIPIVMIETADPVGMGLVASLSRLASWCFISPRVRMLRVSSHGSRDS